MDTIRIKTYVLGPVSTNCYIVFREGSKHAIVIDPADRADVILAHCRDLGVEPEAILLTHGHFDHMMAAQEIREQTKALVYACEKEQKLLGDASLNLSSGFIRKPYTLQADRLVKEGDRLEFSDLTLEVMETPGHTAGSVCYYEREEGILFSGDTLFAGSYGRVDFPTGSLEEMAASLRKRLFLMPDDVMVYSGHGEATTIGYEKQYNPAAGTDGGGRR